MSGKPKLSELRDEIEQVDQDLITMLAKRVEIALDIGRHKQGNPDIPLKDDDREQRLHGMWAGKAREVGISDHFTERILREILRYSRRNQERVLGNHEMGVPGQVARVGYQGVEGSYSDFAITRLFEMRSSKRVERRGFRTFSRAADALASGDLDYALLPVENTIAGSINEVYDLLSRRRLRIVDEEILQVEHCLAGISGANLEGIRSVRSHPMALQQCQRFLDTVEGLRVESYFDTAAAARSVAEFGDPSLAAICSEGAASKLGLQVLKREIADRHDNFTRFLLISLESEKIDSRMPVRTSLILTLNHRRGALAKCLEAFARQDVNLTKLESRPQPSTPWEYLFYVDIEGHADDPRVQRALDEVRANTNHLKMLGSYPRRTEGNEPCLPGEEVGRENADTVQNVAAVPVPPPGPTAPSNASLRLCARNGRTENTVLRIGAAEVGGDRFTLIAGPCAVESRNQIFDAAEMVKACGATLLRGGAFKPRSSPYSFQGLGFPGVDLLAEAGHHCGLPVVTEVLRPEDAERIAEKADVLQVGARNMQNFELLKVLGTLNRPVLLKRGMSATAEELLLAAEYIMAGGNQQVILCERGIRTFETATRATLDVSAVPVLKSQTHLPVIVDPSHAAGRRDLVLPLARAAAAAGADGLIVEAHPNREEALCDKAQALSPSDLECLRDQLRPIVEAQGRRL